MRYSPNTKPYSVHHWNQNRNKAENKWSSLQERYLFICLFDFKAQFVCAKDRRCLRMAIAAYCLKIFGSIFCLLFCLLTKKLILRCKTIWQIWESFCEQFEVWEHFLVWTKKKHFFFKTAHFYGLNFLDNNLFIRPENLKT